MQSDIILVVARADNGVIGKSGALPWHIPADLRHFKAITMGSPMIMGRRTFASLPNLLPGRRHIVVTRDASFRREGVEVAHSMEEALRLADAQRISIIGGAEIFGLFLPLAAVVELTEVHEDVEGDTFMPALDPSEWREVSRDDHPSEGGRPAYSFIRLERRRG